MNSRPQVDMTFSKWLVTRSLDSKSNDSTTTGFSIAIESPCVVCQPRVALPLADYLMEFDDRNERPAWLPVTDHRLEQLQAHPEFRQLLRHDNPDDPASAIANLSRHGGVIFELPNCHLATEENNLVFQVAMSCQRPSTKNHHLWINAKRMSEKTLVPMIASAFFDWACHGGDRTCQPSHKNS